MGLGNQTTAFRPGEYGVRDGHNNFGSVRRGAFRRCNRPADALNAPLGDG